MPPKKETPKKVAKRAPSKSPAKRTLPTEADLKKQLLFLWACHKISGATANMSAVAEHFGIKTNAAQMRFSRMKRKIEELQAAEDEKRQGQANSSKDKEADHDSDMDDDADVEDEGEDCKIKTEENE